MNASSSKHAAAVCTLLWVVSLRALAQVPHIVMKHGDAVHHSTVGTSAWHEPGDKDGGMADDHFGVVTSSTPIVVRRNDTVSFEIPEREHLEVMYFSITRVTDKDIRRHDVDKQFPDIITWTKETHPRKMTKSQRESIVLNQPPGDYILEMWGQWKDFGDASHGFYLRVTQ